MTLTQQRDHLLTMLRDVTTALERTNRALILCGQSRSTIHLVKRWIAEEQEQAARKVRLAALAVRGPTRKAT